MKSSLVLARTLRLMDKEVLLNQFSVFSGKLEEVTKDISEENLLKMDSKDLIVRFFNSEAKLFCGIELILEAIAVASIKISVESVAESSISDYNRRNDKL